MVRDGKRWLKLEHYAQCFLKTTQRSQDEKKLTNELDIDVSLCLVRVR